ncbi:hypothetical protein ZIOFF_064268 [Zingiber officinale]|uniref:ORM1-like protein 3 n=1 Tax=Zingiber officinale TaxID=94328 RepID=A0A8J5K9Y5_ZINOF|nr:hypothetical protein ZIOFF_064268 [Zingiber officinale]
MICSRYQRWPKFSAGPFRLLGRLLFLTSFSFEPFGRGFASFRQSLSLVNPRPDCCRREIGGEVLLGRMTKLYVEAVQPADLNKNTEWFMYPGVWTTYILILFFSWLLVLSLFGCAPGMAWTFVNLAHFAKGTPFSDDQGIYNSLTWWEQMDNGKQLTRNRKFLAVVPVVLYLIASHTTDYRHPMLFLNTVAVTVLVVAKLPNMHKVRIFGINAGH